MARAQLSPRSRLPSTIPSKRGFLRANLLALAITIGAIVGMGLVAAAMAATAAITDLIPSLSGAGKVFGQIATYAILAALGALGAGWLYRRVPNDTAPGFRDVLPGALVASIGLVVLTLAFGFYVANFGSYNATYGSLGAVVVLLTWLYLSAYVLLVRRRNCRCIVPGTNQLSDPARG